MAKWNCQLRNAFSPDLVMSIGRYDNIPCGCIISMEFGIYVWWQNLISYFKQVNNLREKMKFPSWLTAR
jgi:hypothetical protein